MTESRWLQFVINPNLGVCVTNSWGVVSKTSGGVLGEVRWFGRWRQYAFFPEPETVFNPECLGDLAAFVAEQTRLHRLRRKP